MSDSFFIMVIIAVGLATLICRGGFIVPENGHVLSKRLEGVLEFVPIAAMSAIAMSSLVYDSSSNGYTISIDRLIVGGIAFGVAYFSKSAVATIFLGMVALWVLQSYNL